MIDEAWDLPALREHYEQFIADFNRLRPRGGAASFAAQTALVHAWRRFPFIDPDLPDDLLPRDWPRRARLRAVQGPPRALGAGRAGALRGARVAQAHLRRLRRRHDRDEGHRQRLRARPGPPDRAGPRPPRAATRSQSSSITEYEPLLDSANARPSDWLRIARDIVEHRHHYDGFVVLHGTDTMAYTASALAFLLRGLGKPVIITGSQIPLGVLRSDGRQNFLTAVLVAARDDVKEVCLVFGSKILRGARAVKASASGFEAFASPNLPPLGQAGVEIEIDESRLRDAEAGRDRAAARRSTRRSALLRLYPGHARRAAARGDGGAGARAWSSRPTAPAPCPTPTPSCSRRSPRAPPRRRRHRRQPVRRRPRRPGRLRDQRAADRGRRGRRPRHDHRGRLHEARGAAVRGPRRPTRCAR